MASVDLAVVVVVAAAATVVGEVLVAAAAVADGGVAAVDDFESSGAVAASVEACKLEWLVGRRRLAVMNKRLLLLLLDCLHSPSYGPVDWKFDWMTLESGRKNSAPCGILGNWDLTIPNCWSALSAQWMRE